MNKTDPVISELTKFGHKVLRKFDEINYGGCCVFASLVARHLQRQNVPVRIRASWQEVDHEEDDGWDLSRIRKMVNDRYSIQDWEWNGIIIGHAIVEFEYKGTTWHYDTTGVKKASDRDPFLKWSLYKGFFTVEEAIKFAADDNWNDRFDRDLIPDLEEMVDKFFEKFKIKSLHKQRTRSGARRSGAGASAVRLAKQGERSAMAY